ncbi:MAG TPA: hypothetical protein VIY29_22930 [Ktedonobacteraceae bacterium]
MKSISSWAGKIAVAALILAVAPAFAQQYKGRLSTNPYAPDSTSNPYGKYGSPYSPNSINDPYAGQTNDRLYGSDGTYLGNLNSNPYDPNSTSNPYGKYGSPYSPDSVNNPYGKYGSPYSPNSANNPYTTDAPKIIGVN